MSTKEYQCMKCGNNQYESGEFRATGGKFSKIFDVQNKKFTTITCTQCKYTEIYQADSSTLMNILDFFTN